MRSGERLLCWDRDFGSFGNPIREDIRSAARDLWDHACQQARTFLGDVSDAPELVENCVLQVSHYLDRRAVPLFEKDLSALPVCAFFRRLRRHVSKLRRLKLTADISTLRTSGPR